MQGMTRTGLAMTAALLLVAPLSAQGPAGASRAARVAVDRAESVPVLLDRVYTVRVASFADPEGRVSTRVAERLRSASIPVWVTRFERRGHTVARLRIGAVTSREDAELLQRVLNDRLSWPTYVARMDAAEVTYRGVRGTLALLQSN